MNGPDRYLMVITHDWLDSFEVGRRLMLELQCPTTIVDPVLAARRQAISGGVIVAADVDRVRLDRVGAGDPLLDMSDWIVGEGTCLGMKWVPRLPRPG